MAMAKALPRKQPSTLIIRTCRQCKAKYEQEPLAAKDLCEYCRPVKNCLHGIKLTSVCQECMRRFGSKFQRVM